MTTMAQPGQMMQRQKSNLSRTNMLVVDEFQDDDTDDGSSPEQPETPHDGDKEGSGKLARWFKGLFKGKDKGASRTSSGNNSAANSRVSSTTLRVPASPGTGPAQTSPEAGANYSHSKSTTLPSPGAVSKQSSKVIPRPHVDEVPHPHVKLLAEEVSPANRAKSVSLKSELQRLRNSPMQHSKSFTELSNKAKVIPKRGNEVLVTSPAAPPRMQRADWSLRDYAVVEKMYKGYASSVYKAFCKRSGELVCLKAYDMAALCELNRFQIYREVQLHGKLSHPNVIGLYGAFQVDSQVVMVQEFADGGDLFTLLHRYGGRMPERQAVEMVLQPCLKVLSYLHEQGMLHRDLKPENILFTRNMTFKLCDFGLAIDLRDERAVTRAGTLEYMAPEVLECPFKSRPIDNKDNERLHYTAAVDAWAVGVLAYELLVGRPPFEAAERDGVEECIRHQTPRYPFGLSELARSFIATALHKDPDQRPTVSDLLQHPLITGASAPPPQRLPPVATTSLNARIAAGPASPTAGPSSPTAFHTPRPPATPPPLHPVAAALAAGAGSGGAGSMPLSGNALMAKKAVGGSRAIAKAGGMDGDGDFGLGAMANRMKSYTAGKAIAISHQPLQANRHVHLPHVAEDRAVLGGGGGAGGSGGRVGELSTPHPPTLQVQPSGGAGAGAGAQNHHHRLAALNPKLAAQLGAAGGGGGSGGGAGVLGGMVGRTASVSRIL